MYAFKRSMILFSSALALASCAKKPSHLNPTSPPAQVSNLAQSPPTPTPAPDPLNRLVASKDCNVQLVSEKLKDVQMDGLFGTTQSIILTLEFDPDNRTIVHHVYETCFPAIGPIDSKCHSKRSPDILITYSKDKNGFLIYNTEGRPWGFMNLKPDSDAAEMVFVDDALKHTTGKSVAKFIINGCR